MTTSLIDFDQLIAELEKKHAAAQHELSMRMSRSRSAALALDEARAENERARAHFSDLTCKRESVAVAAPRGDETMASVGGVLRNGMPDDDAIAAARTALDESYAALRAAERQSIISSNAVHNYSRDGVYAQRIVAAMKAKASASRPPVEIEAQVTVEKLVGKANTRKGLPLYVSSIQGTIDVPPHMAPEYHVGEPLTHLYEVYAMARELASAGVFGVAPSQETSQRFRAKVCRVVCTDGRLPDDLRTVMSDYADWLDTNCDRWPDASYKAVWLHSARMRTGHPALLCAETQRDPNAMLRRWMPALCEAISALCIKEPHGRKRSVSGREDVPSKRANQALAHV